MHILLLSHDIDRTERLLESAPRMVCVNTPEEADVVVFDTRFGSLGQLYPSRSLYGPIDTVLIAEVFQDLDYDYHLSAEEAEMLPQLLIQIEKRRLSRSSEMTGSGSRQPSHSVKVYTFGGFRVEVDEVAVEDRAWETMSARWLFLKLMANRSKVLTEDELCQSFWPASPRQKARRSLLSAVHRARKALGEADLIVRVPGAYTLCNQATFAVDYESFAELHRELELARVQEAEGDVRRIRDRMASIYRGPFIPNCRDSWCVSKRQEFEKIYGDVV